MNRKQDGRDLAEENKFRPWTAEQYYGIVEALKDHGCTYLKGREEYVLFKQIIENGTITEVSKFSNPVEPENTVKQGEKSSGVISSMGAGNVLIDTTSECGNTVVKKMMSIQFLKPLDVQKRGSIAEVIPSFRAILSNRLCLNIGFDTEFQDFRERSVENRRLLSLQMSINIGDQIMRYFFLIDPRYQEVTADGGKIPLKYCLSDILCDLKNCHLPELPLVSKRDIVYKEKLRKDHTTIKFLNYKEMKDQVIPITLICHTGKADISVFRRSKYDVDLVRKFAEIQGGWMTVEKTRLKAENDRYYNYYWLIDLKVRDTLGLTPDENKSLKALGKVIGKQKMELPEGVISNMCDYAVRCPVEYYEYAMNDADIVVSFCSELFQANHAVPMTLSSAAATSMRNSIMRYLGVKRRADYDRVYRGLEKLDEGIIPDKDEKMRFLSATRYVPIRDNPDARLVNEYFEEAYVGGFNASFYLGWITERTTDYDLQNAYPTAMANIIDIDWEKPVRDFPKNYELSLQDIINPLIPSVAVVDFDFPDTCYCPNIPVPVKGGLKIYPRHGKNVYVTGPDMYLALKLGARIKVFRGFTCMMLQRKDGKPSQCLAYAVTNLVQDRMLALKKYEDNPLVEKSLKTMVCSCYGKTAQNVSPKTRYNARKMGRVSAEPSSVTSPYHAAYTTALVRCMLIACINQLHDMGYNVYSVTTDGFITDAPDEVIRSIDGYGFTQIFQNGRYILNQTREDCPANHIWEAKHYNDVFLNITTRGNVAVNDEGVLAHNSYVTGEVKDSRADRDAYIIAVLSREGKLKCPTKVWTTFSEQVERKHDFHVTETMRQLSMNFDYKRCPIIETAIDTPVHYTSVDGQYTVNTVIAEFDTRPFDDAEEFLNYRTVMKSENCVKVRKDLERVKVKSSVKTKGYIGKDLDRKIILSILMGYRSGLYKIPALDGLKQKQVVEKVNSWGISEITINDWKNCSRTKRQDNMLPNDVVKDMLQKIQDLSKQEDR